jgi:RNA polymerase sigma-70 factor, ECF subfamily
MENTISDRELVQRLLAKDTAAEQYFFNTYREPLYKACVYVLGHQDPEAEDVTQETFIVALGKLKAFEFRSTLHHWLFRISMNLCYQRIRKRKRQVLHLDGQMEALSGSLSVDHQRRQEEDTEKEKRIRVIEAQRELLGDPCRKLLDLRDVKKKNYAYISKALKVPIGTVMSRLARCKEALKQLVQSALGDASNA